MKVLQSVLALLLVLVLGCATTSTVSAATLEEAASGDLIATLEKARDVREQADICLLYTSPSPRDRQKSRMPSSA